MKGDTKSKSGGLTTLDLAHDLPDFVQGHYGPELSQNTRQPVDIQLPDFALELDNSLSLNKERDQQHAQDKDNGVLQEPIADPLISGIIGARTASPPAEDPDSDNDFSVAGAAVPPSAALGLPDFFSDSALNNLTVKNGLSFSDNDDDDECDDVSLELKRVSIAKQFFKSQICSHVIISMHYSLCVL